MMPFPAVSLGWQAPVTGGQTFSATVTIPSGTVGSNLTDFVTLVDLSDMPSGFWAAVKSDGGDIRAYDMSDALIPHDLCLFDYGAETGRLMVKRSITAASDTQFKIKCGDASLSQLATGDTNGRNAVWADYNFAVAFDGTTTDRTGTSRTTSGGILAASVHPGFFRFDSSTEDQIQYQTNFPLTNVYTFGASYYMTAAISGNRHIVSFSESSTNRQSLAVRDTTTDNIGLWNDEDSWLHPATQKGVATSTLYRAIGTQNGSTDRKLYLNGVNEATDVGCSANPTGGFAREFDIGAGPAATEDFIGEIGFVYLRMAELSADWLAAEYESWHSPATFYTVA